MVHDALLDDREMGFWVLRSKKWHPLPLPPTLRNYYAKAAEDPKRNYVRYICWQCFTWKDKLFLLVGSDPAERKSPKDAFNFYVYNPQHDPQDDPWQQIEDPFSCSIHGFNPAIVAVPSLGNVGNCNVALAWSTEACSPEYLKVSIHALLVDNDDNCIRHQCLDELSDMIPSYFIIPNSLIVYFVDIGEGKVCVLVRGDTAEYKKANEVLCVLVLKLGLVQEEEGQRFLSVDLLVNQVYDMEPYTKNLHEVPQGSFVFS
ncbi:hypothetical protein PIB30_100468, partial [Stylosanthes scabra]|nr:hypothetical protein [Stylosanthes scabra]